MRGRKGYNITAAISHLTVQNNRFPFSTLQAFVSFKKDIEKIDMIFRSRNDELTLDGDCETLQVKFERPEIISLDFTVVFNNILQLFLLFTEILYIKP